MFCKKEELDSLSHLRAHACSSIYMQGNFACSYLTYFVSDLSLQGGIWRRAWANTPMSRERERESSIEALLVLVQMLGPVAA